MHYVHKNIGVCSREVEFDLENGIVSNVKFIGGCHGNTTGVALLANGMKAEDVVLRLIDIDCKSGNSCPRQLALAVQEALEKAN